MKFAFPLLASVFFLGSIQAAEPTVDDIVAKLTEALGGSEKFASIQTLRTTSRLQVDGLSELAKVVSTMKTPRMVYTEITRGDNVFVDCFDGHIKWSRFNGGKVKQASDQEAQAYAQDAWVMVDGPLVNYKEKGHRVEYLGEETVNGKATYKMNVVMKSGSTAEIYIDRATNLPIKQISHAAGSGGDIVYYLLDYKTFNGMQWPTQMVFKPTNGPAVRLMIDNIEFNFSIAPAFFQMPRSDE